MSITKTIHLPCTCGAVIAALVAQSLNAGRHPHLRDLILKRQLHVYSCGLCGRRLTVEQEMGYFDFQRRQLIGVFPRAARSRERACGEIVMRLYERSLVQDAPEFIRACAQDFLVRVCFGYEELREKLILDEAGLSDLAIEALKADLLMADPRFAALNALTLRLDAVEEDGRLRMLAEGADGSLLPDPMVWVERSRYDAAGLPSEQLLKLRPGLASGPHVSLLRLFEWPAANVMQQPVMLQR